MKVVEQLSHLGGYEHLIVHKPQLLTEIQETVARVDVAGCKTWVGKGKKEYGGFFYDSGMMNAAFECELKHRRWKEPHAPYFVATDDYLAYRSTGLPAERQYGETIEAKLVSTPGHAQTDFVKDRVAIAIQFKEQALVPYVPFANHLAFYVGDQIDVGVEIMPMKSLQSQMASGVPYYEKGFYDVVRQGRGVPAVPLILIGVEP